MAKPEVPEWFKVTEEQMRFILGENLPADAPIPNFSFGGPMCCYIHGEDHQCGGDPKKCPTHLRYRQRKKRK